MARNSSLDSSLEGREGMVRIGTADAGSLTTAVGTGKHVFALVRLLLIATFLIGCCTGLDTTDNGCFISPFER